MTYRAGISTSLSRLVKTKTVIKDSDPCIVCDGCGDTRCVYKSPRNHAPAYWFLNNKPPPGWKKIEVDGKMLDFCPKCKGGQKYQSNQYKSSEESKSS